MRVDGFTISGGNADGGGIYCGVSSPVIRNCLIKDNFASSEGAGVYCGIDHYNENYTEFLNCVFSNNAIIGRGKGGGAHMYDWFGVVRNCVFTGNSGPAYGGGMHTRYSYGYIINSVFVDNTAGSNGGGMYNDQSDPIVTNCTFTKNAADAIGGGMYNDDSDPVITNCILWDDTAVSDNEISDNGTSDPTVMFSRIEDWTAGGLGNTGEDPDFHKPENLKGTDDKWGTTDDGLRPDDSSCIDSANGNVAPERDISGISRFTPDIGAYESLLYIVAGGEDHTLAIRGATVVEACGSDEFSQLGNGDGRDDKEVLEKVDGGEMNTVFLQDIVFIDAGWYHSLAADRDGYVWSWGKSTQGQLGDGSSGGTERSTPVQVHAGDQDEQNPNGPLVNIMMVSAGRSGEYSLALEYDDTGYVWAWGENIGWIHLQSSIYLTIAMTGINQFMLTWNSVLNYVYYVLTSTDIQNWTVADSNVVGGDGTTNWIDTTSAVKKFYKVKQASPPAYRVKTAWRP